MRVSPTGAGNLPFGWLQALLERLLACTVVQSDRIVATGLISLHSDGILGARPLPGCYALRITIYYKGHLRSCRFSFGVHH